MSSSTDRTVGHDSAALDEIELAGELMIAATASSDERLPTARIDEVLLQPAPALQEAVALEQDPPAEPGDQVRSAAAG